MNIVLKFEKNLLSTKAKLGEFNVVNLNSVKLSND